MWTHKKFKAVFKASYEKSGKDRVFTLSSPKKVVSYESWQAAKRDGWVKK